MGKISTLIDSVALGCIGISLLFGQIIRISPYPGITIALYDLVIGLWIIALALIEKNKPRGTLIPSAIFFIGAFVLSLVTSLGRFSLPEYIVGMLYLCRVGLYLLLYAFLGARQVRWFIRTLFIAGLAVCVLGLIQYMFYWDLRNISYLGWDPHYKRLFSTLLDPNIAGLIIVFTLSHAVIRFFSSKKSIDALFVLIAGISLLLTYSRSSLLAVFVACVTVLFVQKRYKMITLSILGFCLAGALLVSPNQSYSILRKETALARFGSWQDGLEIWKQSPIFGVGFNMLRSIREPDFLKSSAGTVSHATTGIDNWLLFLGATAGIPGVAAGVYFFWKIATIALTGKKDYGALFALCAVLVHGLFINTIFYPWTFLWLLALVKETEYEQRLIYDTKPSAQ